MSLRFKNVTTKPVWVMIERPVDSCRQHYFKEGWWKVAPGKTATVFSGGLHDVEGAWYYYAHSDEGTWQGPFKELVPDRTFEWCMNESSSDCYEVGMREIDIPQSENTHTVNLRLQGQTNFD